ncbi:conjugal transfer protein TraR [Acinetobacter sp. ANC 4470]|uniref:TraR/DksA C4-type zinc finger protein n=1 Tax=Acinetobacter sp. ANC 4470 TaxID=1977881 RepID=UPI000A348C47|nr:TraR/DksA C4-type zinc finger protein [Acinetobacter sp. ANC 4470]OTG68285.1 conjugal transfer protein TraR [Acinetobacter sp. ANC 4470]
MPDLADVANEMMDERLALTLNNRQQYNTVSEYQCEDCGTEIPEQRRALGGVKLCISCQTLVENKQKHFCGKVN